MPEAWTGREGARKIGRGERGAGRQQGRRAVELICTLVSSSKPCTNAKILGRGGRKGSLSMLRPFPANSSLPLLLAPLLQPFPLPCPSLPQALCSALGRPGVAGRIGFLLGGAGSSRDTKKTVSHPPHSAACSLSFPFFQPETPLPKTPANSPHTLRCPWLSRRCRTH